MLVGVGEQLQLTGTRFKGFECGQCLVACQFLVEADDASQSLVGSDTNGESGDGDKFHLELKVKGGESTTRCK